MASKFDDVGRLVKVGRISGAASDVTGLSRTSGLLANAIRFAHNARTVTSKALEGTRE